MRKNAKTYIVTLIVLLAFATIGFGQNNSSVQAVTKAKASGSAAATAEDEVLKRRAGTWDATIEIQISSEKASIKSKGIERDTLTPDGHWLISDFEGEMFGRPFNGHAVTGFDPDKGKYVGVWIDSMRRHLSLVEGAYDAKEKLFTTVSADKDDRSGETTEMKQITDEKDPNVRVVTFPAPVMAGRKLAKMVITYVRRS